MISGTGDLLLALCRGHRQHLQMLDMAICTALRADFFNDKNR